MEERLALLDQAVADSSVISKAKSFEDGEALFQAVKEMELEGIVSKRKGSVYRTNTRSQDWLKVKNYKFDTVFITGIRKDKFAWSLMKDGKHAGICEFVPPAERSAFRKIAEQMAAGEDQQWIYLKPVIQCKVKFQDYTRAGMMRHASFVEFML
ncbi:hypothetical protein CUU66_21425 [Peribacillus deserti]|uniref:ATP-dependent DNA ligase family profile domain-containing protein n=1 Tax=Peribacillus deserti TaxID=673318 RepID=A0A2N5M0J7_9BACI|nr:hypothetical protein CUU66_21425 [Peribacillus deserti]